MCCNSYLLAHIQYGAGGTVRHTAGTNMFSKWNKQTIDLDPIALWKFRLQRDHCLFRRGGSDISPAVGHPVDMDIHADEWLATSNAQDKVGALGSYTGKGEHGLFITRKASTKFTYYALGHLQDLSRLPLVKGGLLDQRIDFRLC